MQTLIDSRKKITRREILKTAAGASIMAVVPGYVHSAEPTGQIPRRSLGNTGETISALGLGGYHIGTSEISDDESIRIMRKAIDNGIDFFDNCWSYHAGRSENRMGNALKDGYRKKVFLMTKIDGRTKKAAAEQIDDCLRRLQTDNIDLMQFHEIIRLEDPDRIFAPDGAMEAMQDAKKAGKIRYIGFTGHKDPLVHLRMLEVASANKFRFDAVQMPLNVMDAHFRSFEKQVVPLLAKDQVGVLGMKSMAASLILQSKTVTAVECLHYAMNLPISTVITGIDSMKILDQAIDAGRTFKPLTADAVAALLARTAQAAASGNYERFKTTDNFDSTAHNPKWLGLDSQNRSENYYG